jgi:hypothetical protein
MVAAMKRRSAVALSIALAAALAAGCGGGESKVTASSLYPQLLPGAGIPGFTLERRLDWSNPVDLVGEGLSLPLVLHPSQAVKEFQDSHLEGSAGEVLTKGAGLNGTEVRLGVAKFKSSGDATKVAAWMAKIPGLTHVRFVVQTRSPLPAGAPKGAKPAGGAPANYLAEFTRGPYLYWLGLHADSSSTAKQQVEAGINKYYDHVQQLPA